MLRPSSNRLSKQDVYKRQYQEFEGHCLTASQLEQAITTLLQRHPMLHIAFRPDGPHAGADAWRRGLPPVSGAVSYTHLPIEMAYEI